MDVALRSTAESELARLEEFLLAGRAWVAIRDSEIAAQSMGVNLAIYKTIAFAYSAALMGLAGALFAHKIAYLAPDIFNILLSIQFLLLVIVGGLGSLAQSARAKELRSARTVSAPQMPSTVRPYSR